MASLVPDPSLGKVASVIGWLFGYLGTKHMNRKNSWSGHTSPQAFLPETSYMAENGKTRVFQYKKTGVIKKSGWISFQKFKPKKIISSEPKVAQAVQIIPVSAKSMSIVSSKGSSVTVGMKKGREVTTEHHESYRKNLAVSATASFGVEFGAPCGIGGSVSVSSTIAGEFETTSGKVETTTDSQEITIDIQVDPDSTVECFIKKDKISYKQETVCRCTVNYEIVFGISGVCSIGFRSIDDFKRFVRAEKNTGINWGGKSSKIYMDAMFWNFQADNAFKSYARIALDLLKDDATVGLTTHKTFSAVDNTRVECV